VSECRAVDGALFVGRIALAQELEHFDLDSTGIAILLHRANDLDGHTPLARIGRERVHRLDDLAERALP